MAEKPRMPIRRCSLNLCISTTTPWRILRKDSVLHPYKIQLTQELKPADHRQRREFANWVLENKAIDNDFCKKIIFSDEVYFHLSGDVNKQNCRIWGSENTPEIHKKPMDSQRVTF